MKKISFILLAILFIGSTSFTANSKKVTTINFTVNPSDWVLQGQADAPGSYLQYRFNTEELTSHVFDKGMVMVYVLGTSGGGWYPLPHSYYNSGTEITTTFNYQNGYVELRSYRSSTFAVSMRYKLVISM